MIDMPSVNLAGPRSDISHFDLRSDLKRSVSAMDEEAAMILSMCSAKMVVPVLETQR